MAVTAAMIKELREATGAGMMDCKKALNEASGDMEAAVKWLREKGLATAAKRSGKVAAEGLALAHVDEETGDAGVVEVNSETDFVAKNDEFRDFVQSAAKLAAKTKAKIVEEFHNEKWHVDGIDTVKDALTEKVGKIGENLQIRRFENIVKDAKGVIVPYIHGGGKIAVLAYLKCEKGGEELKEAGKNVAMQIAAMNPLFISKEHMDPEYIAKEKEILINQAKQDPKNANKPEQVLEKIVDGRLQKQFKEVCLKEQQYIKGEGESVGEYLESVAKKIGSPIEIAKYVRYHVGEGIEKVEENFADEVAKVIGKE